MTKYSKPNGSNLIDFKGAIIYRQENTEYNIQFQSS